MPRLIGYRETRVQPLTEQISEWERTKLQIALAIQLAKTVAFTNMVVDLMPMTRWQRFLRRFHRTTLPVMRTVKR